MDDSASAIHSGLLEIHAFIMLFHTYIPLYVPAPCLEFIFLRPTNLGEKNLQLLKGKREGKDKVWD